MAYTAAQVEVKFNSAGANKVKSDINSIGNAAESVDKKSQGFLKGAFQQATGFFGGMLIDRGVSGLLKLGSGFISANADAETMRMQLEVATGSVEKADKVFNNLKAFAKSSPFEFPELANSARMLETFGMSSQDWIQTLGDTSAATGKSIDQVTNALLDAQTGEFERLKELGIRTIEEGGQTYFQYMDKNGKLVKKAIDRNNPEIIESTLQGIWNEQYGGAMDKMADTWQGKWSTMKDNINMMLQDMGKPIFELAKTGVGMANTWFDEFERLRGKGLSPLAAAFEAFKDTLSLTFGEAANPVRRVLTQIVTGVQQVVAVISSVAGVIAGIVGGALAGAFSFLANNIDLVVGAAKGIGALVAGFLAFSAVTSIITAVGVALAALLSPISLLIGAAALIGIAYQKNFLGFGDAVRRVASEIKNFIDGFRAGMSAFKGDNPVAKFLKGIEAGLKWIGGDNTPAWLVDIAEGFGDLADKVEFAANVFGNLLDSGLNPVEAALRTLGTVFPSLSGVMREFYSYLVNIKDGFLALAQGNFGEAFKNFAQAGLDAIQALWEAFQAIPWGDVWNGLVDAWDAIPWTEMASRARDWIVQQFRDAGGSSGIFQWISDALMDALQQMSFMLQTGLQLAWNAISDINWGDFIPDLSWGDFIQGVVDVVSWLDQYIDPIDWAVYIVGQVADFASWLKDKVTQLDLPSKVIGTVGDFVGLVRERVTKLDLPSKVIGTVGDFVSLVRDRVTKLDLPGKVKGSVEDFVLLVRNKVSAVDLVGRVKGVVDDFVQLVKDKVSSLDLPGRVKGAIEDFGEWLKQFVTNTLTFPSASSILDAIPWPDMPSIEWPSPGDILGVIGGIIGVGGDDDGEGGGAAGSTGDDGYNPNTTPRGGGAPAMMTGDWSQFPGLGDISQWASQIASAMSDITSVIDVKASEWDATLQSRTSGMAATVGSTFGALPPVASGPLSSLAASVGMYASSMAATGASNFNALLGSAQATFPSMSSVGSSASNAMNTAVTASLNAMRSAGSIAVAGLNTGVALSMAAMRAAGTSNASQMGTQVTASVNTMRSTSSAAVAGMQAGIAASMLFMRSNATSQANSMRSSVVSAMQSMGSQAASAVRSGMNQIPGIISSVGGFAASVARGVGAQIGNGVASGMMSALGAIRAAASAMINEALRAAQARAIISSPSRLFERAVGVFLPQGVAGGIEHDTPLVERAARQMIDRTLTAARGLGSVYDPFVPFNGPTSPAGHSRVVAPFGHYPTERPDGTGGQRGSGHVFLVISREVLQDFIDTVEGFQVITNPTELKTAMGE